MLTGSVAGAAPALPEAAASATVGIDSQQPSVSGCGTTRVEIWVRDISDLYGADIRFTFDPSILQVADADPATPGTQITPLAGFLKPEYIARKIACNVADPDDPNCPEAGVVWYAATQLAPTEPVSGSGPIAAIDFLAVAPGVSAFDIFYSKVVRRDGAPIPASLANHQLTAVAPDSPQLSIGFVGPDTAALSWSGISGAALYRLFRDTAPYFEPADPPHDVTGALSFDDAGAVGDSEINYFYTVKSGCSTGFQSEASNEVGEFDYELIRGS